MSSKFYKTGGQAFPDEDHYGLTILDYFAAKAMAVMLAKSGGSPAQVAESAYLHAVAMLKAKEMVEAREK